MYVEVKPPHNSSVDDCFLCGNSFPRPSECRDCAVPPGLSRTLLSPLLGGPFLISPRRRQSATPDTPSRESRCINTITPPGLGPHRCLRDSYEARSPLGSGLTPCPAGLPANGFSCISTHRVSIRPSHPSLYDVSRLAPTSRLFFPSAHRSRPIVNDFTSARLCLCLGLSIVPLVTSLASVIASPPTLMRDLFLESV